MDFFICRTRYDSKCNLREQLLVSYWPKDAQRSQHIMDKKENYRSIHTHNVDKKTEEDRFTLPMVTIQKPCQGGIGR